MSAPEKFADLHLHTFYSDGTDSPESLVARAKAQNLACIALTDHDTVAGIAETEAAAAAAGVEFIAGIEITAHLDETELHILGYGMDWCDESLQKFCMRVQAVRRERIERICVRLHELGVPLTLDAILKLGVKGSLGRPHVARALLATGYITSTQEAFTRFLGRGKPAFVPKWMPTVAEVTELIRSVGGVAVLAHPGLAKMDARIAELQQHGIQGLEVFHSSHSADAMVRYERIARDLGLLITGGSDCHGQTKGAPTMGVVKLPYEHVEALRAACQSLPKTHCS